MQGPTKVILLAAILLFAIDRSAVIADETARQQLLKTRSCPNCNLTGADLREKFHDAASQAPVNLIGANLSGASLSGANLKGALLTKADLGDSHLQGTDLSDALMNETNLTGAVLDGTKLEGAKMFHANLSNAVFEPASMPNIQSMSGAKGLKFLTWMNSPNMLLSLAQQIQRSGDED